MPEPTKPSRRAADRARDAALLKDLMSPDADLITLATTHFRKRDPLKAFIRWFTPERKELLCGLVAISDLRASLTIARARQPAAAALLRLTTPENNPETARKASADLLKSAPKRAEPSKPAPPQTIPARSDADQHDMDSILDRMMCTNTVDARAHTADEHAPISHPAVKRGVG